MATTAQLCHPERSGEGPSPSDLPTFVILHCQPSTSLFAVAESRESGGPASRSKAFEASFN
jgi:hypothetical protein